MNHLPYIISFGSLHYDITVNSPRQPVKGETLPASSWAPKCGGKGGNQALASARCGVKTYMVGCVADDHFGAILRKNLQENHVDCSYLRYGATQSTGMSVALFDPQGDYSALIVSGANLTLGEEDVQAAQDLLSGASITLLQNEVPEKANILAAQATKKGRGQVIFNAAPARPISHELIQLCDFIIVNKIEAEMLSQAKLDDTLDDAMHAALALHEQFKAMLICPPIILVTMGGAGVACADMRGHCIKLPAEKIQVRNSHGAGDEFIGAFAAHIARGHKLEAALRAASKAAAARIATPHPS